MPQPDRTTYDVAILGFGPTGATLANLLGKAGLSVLVLEREAAIHPLPRAVHFDGEAMRIFQAAGLADQVARISRPSTKGMHFVSGTGKTLLIRKGYEGAGPHGWASNYYVHQPFLEQVLRSGLGRFAHVAIELRHDVTDVAPAPNGVQISATDLASGEGVTFHARYLVGCDGGRSLVRRLIGSDMEDLGLKQPWLVVDVLADTGSPRIAALPDHTVQLCDPARPMTMVYVGGERRRWEIMLMPGDDPAGMTEPGRVWPLLSRWIGPEDGRLERAALYTFHSVIARGWRKGPMLLAGDACHQTPPFLGQGMCAGLRDATNLAWKLVAVVKHGAPGALLDTYESERRPHVHAFIELAVDLGAIIQATDPQRATERDRQFQDGAPQLFDYPLPQLGPGVRDGGPPPAGVVQPQPRLADGRLLDDVTGTRFAVIANEQMLRPAAPTPANSSPAIELCTMTTEGDPGLAALLAGLDAKAIVLRPDGYLLGKAADRAGLERLLCTLDNHVRPGQTAI